MKFLKGFFTVIICIVLVFLIYAFSIIVQAKDAVENQFIVEAIKQLAIEESKSVENSDELIQDLISEEKANDVIESVLKDYGNYVKDEDYEISDETIDLIIQYCEQNREELEKIGDIEIDQEDLHSQEARDAIKNALDESFEDISQSGGEVFKTGMDVYTMLTSKDFILRFGIVIIVLMVIVGVLSGSYYSWMNPLGVTLLVVGIFTLITYAAGNAIAEIVSSELGILVNVKILGIFGGAEALGGLGLLFGRYFIEKNMRKKEKIEPEIVEDNEL